MPENSVHKKEAVVSESESWFTKKSSKRPKEKVFPFTMTAVKLSEWASRVFQQTNVTQDSIFQAAPASVGGPSAQCKEEGSRAGVFCHQIRSMTPRTTLKPMAPSAWAKRSLSPAILATLNLSSAAASPAIGDCSQNSSRCTFQMRGGRLLRRVASSRLIIISVGSKQLLRKGFPVLRTLSVSLVTTVKAS